jgi:SAM-dependent methyltransferase
LEPNLEEYADPELYDLENKTFEPDGPFFLARAQKLAGPVLELGCGTGRVTIPLAQSGVAIAGLDVVPAMLDRARQKAGALSIDWLAGDARSYQLGRSFRLIFETGSVFQHMLTRADQEAFLARAALHLAPGGQVIVSAMFPHAHLLATDETEHEWFTYATPAGQPVRVSGTDRYDALRQVRTETAYRRWVDSTGQPVLRVAPLSLRYTFPQELEALLHYNGFRVVERFGDWDSSPLVASSRMMIFVCQEK